jgi:predicted nucleic acid-binding protein
MPHTYVLDTNAVIYYIGAEEKALPKLVLILQSDNTIILPTIVITELWSGRQVPDTDIEAIEAFISSLVITPFDLQTAKSAGTLRRDYGLKIGDACIAATALAYNAILLTRNTNDFKRVPNLLIEAI